MKSLRKEFEEEYRIKLKKINREKIKKLIGIPLIIVSVASAFVIGIVCLGNGSRMADKKEPITGIPFNTNDKIAIYQYKQPVYSKDGVVYNNINYAITDEPIIQSISIKHYLPYEKTDDNEYQREVDEFQTNSLPSNKRDYLINHPDYVNVMFNKPTNVNYEKVDTINASENVEKLTITMPLEKGDLVGYRNQTEVEDAGDIVFPMFAAAGISILVAGSMFSIIEESKSKIWDLNYEYGISNVKQLKKKK